MRRVRCHLFAGLLLAIAVACTGAAFAQDANPRMVIASPGYMWGIDETIVRELKAEGAEVLTYPDTPSIDGDAQPPAVRSWEQLSRYNILIYGDQFYNRAQPDSDTGEIPEHIRTAVPLLYRFLKEGGGIWFSGPGEADFGNTVKTLNYVIKELDARAIQEVVRDPANLVTLPGGGTFKEWCWTSAVTPHPLTEGVKGLWYPAAHAGDGGMGIVPFEGGAEWTVLLKGMPTATSHGIDPADPAGTKLLKAAGVIKGSPNMIAVREYGRGRVVFWPTWSPFGVFAGSYYADGMLLDGERNGKRSDGKRLIKNLLTWLAEPSQGSATIGLFDPKTAPRPKPKVLDVAGKLAQWRKPGRKDYPKQFKGLIGAHSSLSDGKSTPEQMIAAAERAGYDFIAFTEDLSRMDEEKWGQLVAACDKASLYDAMLVGTPGSGWHSRRKFAEPVRVEFAGVSLDRQPKSGWNTLGLAPGGLDLKGGTVCWAFDGSVGSDPIVPMRAFGGEGFWKEGYAKAIPSKKLGGWTKTEPGLNLAIDWWPGKKIAYYVKGRKVAEFTSSVPRGPLPVGVRNETAGFRIKRIRVTSLRKGRKVLLDQDFSKSKKFDTTQTWETASGNAPTVRQATRGFIAYPGLDCLDDAGNRSVTFGQRWWPPKEAFSTENPGRITWLYGMSYQVSNAAQTWAPRVIIRSKTNNKRPWNQALWSLFGAYCYEGGKLVDDSFPEWRRMMKRHIYFFNTGVVALHTVRSTREISASARRGLYQTFIRADDLGQVLSRITGCVGPYAYFPTYISAGPEILDFRVQGVKGGEGMDLAIPDNDRYLLHILVRAKGGLKEVRLYDGERVVRRFLPKGNEFERFLTFHPDEMHAFSLTVVDARGREAVSWNAAMQIQERVHRRCGDNWNYMLTGKGRRASPHGPHMQEATSVSTAKPRYLCEPAAFHHGGMQPAVGRYVAPDFQNLLVDGETWPGNCPVHVLDFTTIGRYGIMLTNRVDKDYLVGRPKAFTTGAFQGPYAVTDSPWPAELRQWGPEPRFNGSVVSRYSGKVTFNKEIITPDGKPVQIRLGSSDWRGHNPVRKQGCVFEVRQADGAVEKFLMFELKEGTSYDGEVPHNGFVAWYGPDAPGVGGVIALAPGMRYNLFKKGTYSWLSFRNEVTAPVKPGTEATWDCLYVDGSGAIGNSAEEVEDVRRGLGVFGEPTLYKVEPRVGSVAEQKFTLTLAPDDGGFSGRIVRTTAKRLPLHLPVLVRGMNPRWDACVWYRGRTRLEVIRFYRDPWGVKSPYRMTGAYEDKTDEIQFIPVINGDTAYCQIDTDQQDPDVFIGHPLVCDRPEVFITVVKAEKGKCTFEVNNPTDWNLDLTVRPAKGFEYTGQWQRRLSLPRGSFKSMTVRTQ